MTDATPSDQIDRALFGTDPAALDHTGYTADDMRRAFRRGVAWQKEQEK